MNAMTKMKLNIAAHVACFGLSVAALFIGISEMRANAPVEVNVPKNSSVNAPSGLVDLTGAAESAVNSVVYIKVTQNTQIQQSVESRSPWDDFFGDFFGNGGSRQQPRVKKGSGSGVIISSDGYIVTNNHVVEKADEITVKLNDNREFKGRIIGTDKNSDLALVKIEANNLPAIPIGDSDKLKLGEWVLAVGNPFNLTSTVTAGIVSAKARSLYANGVESFIQTDAAINQGNSGGALVNAKGELVGINAMLYSQTGSYSGYGFAIPTTIMNKVVSDLKAYGTVQRAVIGIVGTDVINYIDVEKDKGKEVDLGVNEGVYVNEVPADGAASEAGIEPGDVITAVDAVKVTKMAELQEELIKHKPGDKVTITYVRNKKSNKKTLTLRNEQGTTEKVTEVDPNSLGVVLKPVPAEMKRELALNGGLLVSAVTNGKMKDAGVTKGVIILEVNNKKVNTVEEFQEIVKVANMSTDRVLLIRAKSQSGRNLAFAVELGESK